MTKIILTNQHSDNRGDESATLGAIKSLRRVFGMDTDISIYLQSGTKFKFLPDECAVNEREMITSIWGFVELTIWVIFKAINIDLRKVMSKRIKSFIDEHDIADIVISSCGGPYIGDIYINHEIIHLVHLAVPLLLHKKTAFFAPSMGPFKNKFMNKIRKIILKKVGLIILRDDTSHMHVKNFLPNNTNIYRTADACLADDLDFPTALGNKGIIGVTPIDYGFPLANDKENAKVKYETALVGAIDRIMEKDNELRVEFFPQLFAKHSDVPYIGKIIRNLKYPERTIVFSDQKGGRDQQREISTVDYMIASRYHSAIFACKANTPVVCIAYEHKAKAFMEMAHMEEYCLDIYQIDEKILFEKISLLKDNYDRIKIEMPEKMTEVIKSSKQTADLIYQYYLAN